ncbi:hypothetical protein PanWU01x14_068630, partial [Parasponia andersonii]
TNIKESISLFSVLPFGPKKKSLKKYNCLIIYKFLLIYYFSKWFFGLASLRERVQKSYKFSWLLRSLPSSSVSNDSALENQEAFYFFAGVACQKGDKSCPHCLGFKMLVF